MILYTVEVTYDEGYGVTTIKTFNVTQADVTDAGALRLVKTSGDTITYAPGVWRKSEPTAES
jgi:hypothetical protein